MSDSSSQRTSGGPAFLEEFGKTLKEFIKDAWNELWGGIRNNTLPWPFCCGVGAVFALVFAFRLDALAWRLLCWKHVNLTHAYPFHPLLYWPYVAYFITSGFWTWAFARAAMRRPLAKRLQDAFRVAGLETRIKRLPGFVANERLDHDMRRLVVTSVGISEDEFKRAKGSLESSLRVYIDKITAHVNRGTVEIIYSHEPMPTSLPFDLALINKPFTFLVGKTRTKLVYACLRDIPHILLAGLTNSGKSSMLRQLLVTLMVNNRGTEFTLVDLKEGNEFSKFNGLPHVRVYISPRSALGALKFVEGQLEKRMVLLRENGCNNIDAFNRIPEEKRTYTTDWPKGKPLVRHIVVIDEAAQLFVAGSVLSSKEVQEAKRLTIKIGALGRAVGVHLIIATQRPDKQAVDPLIKANMYGRLCYQMADNASSMTILDSVRAADLPADKGRAIWRAGLELTEVQTPWLDGEKEFPSYLEQIKSLAGEGEAKASDDSTAAGTGAAERKAQPEVASNDDGMERPTQAAASEGAAPVGEAIDGGNDE